MVGSADIERLMTAARTHVERDGRTLLHMNCISYRLDGAAGIGEPLGLAGRTLGADLHAVTADEAPLHNLLHVGRARLPVGSGPRARRRTPADLAATTEEERQLGVVAIDIGAGTTTLAAFARGHLLSTDVVPVGGNHVTLDLAQALSAPAYEAERIKKDYGTLARGASDDHEVVSVRACRRGRRPVRAETTKGEVRDHRPRPDVASLRSYRRADRAFRRRPLSSMQRMVLTGGGSQLAGLGEFAADFFARPVRIARIEPFDGMPAGFDGPAFSTAVGLIHVALDPSAGTRGKRGGREAGGLFAAHGTVAPGRLLKGTR